MLTAPTGKDGVVKCGAEVGRFIIMLRNGSIVLKSCDTFSLLEFTMPC